MAIREMPLRENDVRRVEIHHPEDRVAATDEKDAAFVRVCRMRPYTGSVYVSIFAEGDPADTERLRMNLFPEMVDELVAVLQSFRQEVAG